MMVFILALFSHLTGQVRAMSALAVTQPPAISQPHVQPAPAPKAKPAPAAQPKSATFQDALNAAVVRIPGASSGTWVVRDLGAWARTDLATCITYVAPRTPGDKLSSVVAHEYAHQLQCHLYGSLDAANAALGSVEINADCVARLLGATWTDYTQHCSATEVAKAQKVLHGTR